MAIEIWCTLGPASLKDSVIHDLEQAGADLFRINLSHTSLDQLPEILQYLNARTHVPICLDTEGAQIRTKDLMGGSIIVRAGEHIRIHHNPISPLGLDMNLHPDGVSKKLISGDTLLIDAEVLADVQRVETEYLELIVTRGGTIRQNKAVTVLDRDIELEPLTAKDRRAITKGTQMGVRHVALSFTHSPADIDTVRSHVPSDTEVIAKIECLEALNNLAGIGARSDGILIDRGDLARQVPIARIPVAQKQILRFAKRNNKKVFVATNLLEFMVTQAQPTCAEANDVFHALENGAQGLVLAAETAIGAYPVEAVKMLRSLIAEYTAYAHQRN